MATSGERMGQRAVRAMARGVFGKAEASPIDRASIRRVLVIRTDDRVGNVLLTTPLVRALRQGLPHARIDWLVTARRRLLVEGLFLADALVPWDKRLAFRNPPAFASFLRRLRSARYDVVIDAAHYDAFSLTAAMLSRWTAAPVRIGHARGDAEHYYTHPVPTPDGPSYDVAAKLSLLDPLGIESAGNELETSVGRSAEVVEAAEKVLSSLGLANRPFAVVNPGARKLDRRLAPEAIAEVVRLLSRKHGVSSLVVWGPGEEDLAQAVVAAAGDAGLLAPPTDLHLLSALLRRAALLVTNDTGPMHLGVACETPTLALFTVADAARWGHPIPSFRAVEVSDGSDVSSKVDEPAAQLLSVRRRGLA